MEKIVEVIAELQAQALAHSTVLEAMLMAHPDPKRLREEWHRISAPRIASSASSLAGKGRPVDEAMQFHLLSWQRKVDREAGFPAP